MTFGETLRFYRRRCGYSQKRLAAELCVERSLISHYERDLSLPGIRCTLQMARLFGVRMETFFEGEAAPRAAKRRRAP